MSEPDASTPIEAGVRYLLAHRQPDGSWRDWALPPGPSGPWVTAYVAARIPAAGAGGAARTKAAHWLLDHECVGGGWGYNDRTGADADSTAHAILFLASAGVAVPGSAVRRLLAFQRPDGGFATYDADTGLGSWGGQSHPDVTPAAALALTSVSPRPRDAVARAVHAVRRARRPDGLWNSFWWDTPLYASAWSLAALPPLPAPDRDAVLRALRTVPARSAFAQALLVRCRSRLGDRDVPRAVERLAGAIRGDGSWPAVPVLRITDRSCETPWDQPRPGPLYADPARLFTTATVVDALRGGWAKTEGVGSTEGARRPGRIDDGPRGLRGVSLGRTG